MVEQQEQGEVLQGAEQGEEQMTQVGGEVGLTLSGRRSQSQVFVVLQGDLMTYNIVNGGGDDRLGVIVQEDI